MLRIGCSMIITGSKKNTSTIILRGLKTQEYFFRAIIFLFCERRNVCSLRVNKFISHRIHFTTEGLKLLHYIQAKNGAILSQSFIKFIPNEISR